MKDELMTVEEAALFAKVNKETIRRWVRQGKVAYLRIDSTLRIWKSSLNGTKTDG